jgi:Na+/H+ antiporter NhaD/arsenite permease-like protein
MMNRSLLKKPDYRLLLTFIFLFIAIGNVSHIPALKEQIETLATTPIKTYSSALLLSQIISNVPCTIMLAPFTEHVRALFYGVNIGGLGTPVASLASIIAYSLFSGAFPLKKNQFMRYFLFYNFSLLIVLGVIFAALL